MSSETSSALAPRIGSCSCQAGHCPRKMGAEKPGHHAGLGSFYIGLQIPSSFFFLLREKTKDLDSRVCMYSLDFLKCNSACPQKLETRLPGAQDGLGTRELTGSGCKVSLCWDDNILTSAVQMPAHVREYTANSWAVPLKWAHCRACPSYFNKAIGNAQRRPV